MQPFYPSPASLQHALQSGSVVPEYIQVKAKGFKAILRSTVEFLEAYQVQANLFVKLPAGTAWQDDIQRYSQTLGPSHRIFQFVRLPTEEADRGKGRAGVTLPLRDLQTWRGDYFLIIHASTFAGLVVAHRLQPLSASPLTEPSDDDNGDTYTLDQAESLAPEVSPELEAAPRSIYLSVCASINPDLLHGVMAALYQQVSQLAAREPIPALVDLANQWTQYCSGVDRTTEAFVTMVDRWLIWQLRLQEQMRQSISTYRRQAMGLSSLSSQNEVLINTLRLKDEFLNTVGQELRTPLTTIKTALTLLDSSQIKPPQRQRYMDMISHECDRQSALISGVLNLLHMETSVSQTQLAPVYLVDIVPPVVSTYQPLAEEKGILLAYTIPSNLPLVACPEAWLRQVMIHLLNNSIKYTPSGGEVWVSARRRGDFAEIEVRDTGLGIAPSDLPNIFDYFFRGRNLPSEATEGAGLGLSIVQQLLLLCGGNIVVNSQLDSGSTFVVQLPLHQS